MKIKLIYIVLGALFLSNIVIPYYQANYNIMVNEILEEESENAGEEEYSLDYEQFVSPLQVRAIHNVALQSVYQFDYQFWESPGVDVLTPPPDLV